MCLKLTKQLAWIWESLGIREVFAGSYNLCSVIIQNAESNIISMGQLKENMQLRIDNFRKARVCYKIKARINHSLKKTQRVKTSKLISFFLNFSIKTI